MACFAQDPSHLTVRNLFRTKEIKLKDANPFPFNVAFFKLVLNEEGKARNRQLNKTNKLTFVGLHNTSRDRLRLTDTYLQTLTLTDLSVLDVTRYTSRVTCHALHVTRYISIAQVR